MRTRLYAQLCGLARRESGDAANAEDVVQEALLVAVIAGRRDLNDPSTGRWLAGIVRNKARMARRGTYRRQRRDSDWQSQAAPGAGRPAAAEFSDLVRDLSPALRAVAALALSGHSRREIAWLLRLPDTALRHRISALRRQLAIRGVAVPETTLGLSLDLAYGRIRDALVRSLHTHGGMFATHDPDGHLFVVSTSQNGNRRQLHDVSIEKGASQ